MRAVSTPPRVLRCGAHRLSLGRRPLVMGIVNVTPDSFSDGGRFFGPRAAADHARALVDQGADIIDVGGESTRPGAEPVPVEEELRRVIPVIEALVAPTPGSAPPTKSEGPSSGNPVAGVANAARSAAVETTRRAVHAPLSIDTRRAEVARAAVAAGAAMINDVSGGREAGMLEAMAEAGDGVAVVLMHMRGEPGTMQNDPQYTDVVSDVCAFLRERAEAAVRAGVDPSRIVLDPGIGFGKRTGHNLALLKSVDALSALGYPLLVGASRKRFLGEITGAPPDRRLAGSLAVAARCHAAGVGVVRVHDVRETVALFDVLDAIATPETRRNGKNS